MEVVGPWRKGICTDGAVGTGVRGGRPMLSGAYLGRWNAGAGLVKRIAGKVGAGVGRLYVVGCDCGGS